MIKIILLSTLLIIVSSTYSVADFEIQFVLASDTELKNPHDLKLSPDGKYLFVSGFSRKCCSNQHAAIPFQTFIKILKGIL